MEHGLPDFLEAVAHMLGAGDVVLGIADDFADAPGGLFGLVDPIVPFIFTAELDVSFAQEQEELDSIGVDKERQQKEGHHDPSAAFPNVSAFKEDI